MFQHVCCLESVKLYKYLYILYSFRYWIVNGQQRTKSQNFAGRNSHEKSLFVISSNTLLMGECTRPKTKHSNCMREFSSTDCCILNFLNLTTLQFHLHFGSFVANIHLYIVIYCDWLICSVNLEKALFSFNILLQL